jgi:hypothetical protein
MLVTNKINLFSSLFGKSRSTNMAKVSDGLKALGHKAKNLIDLEEESTSQRVKTFIKPTTLM